MIKIRSALGLLILYLMILFCAAVVTFRLSEPPTDTIAVMWRLLPVKLLLLALCLGYVRYFSDWYSIGFRRPHWPSLLWLLPSIALMAVMASDVAGTEDQRLIGLAAETWGLLVVVPLLIGITEEIVFRGVLLRALNDRLPVFWAMLISAALFALMHFINDLNGQPWMATLQQVGFAFLVGVFLAAVALRTGNLWGVIIWHALWDFLVYLSRIAEVLHPYALIGIMIQTLVSLWLWAQLIQDDHQREVS
ncbi:CPBP family intramembrane glutamic endopeptidase [Loktanella sp. S4079]|uniref:CPBP family intramembrane glutamic endopeptidase n=1 Tax=Loktanella sp. S4079 TaxID=579483 RepID=UPI0005FA7E38|nr:CPBP family intramembrane glutamic endopeptidase [Loktanella sp. S4079]KJZ20740.1 hypothetical protein TW80_08265 [Loktanella sp. S4079]